MMTGAAGLVVLIAITALGQVGVNIILPALSLIADAVGIPEASAGLVLSIYLVGLAGGQLVAGPLSDRFGRRPVLLAGIALFIAGGAVAALARDSPTLFAARLVQGGGASAGLALGRAIARDLFEGERLVRTLSIVSMAMAVVPGIAPFVGGVIADAFGAPATFWASALAGLALLVVVARAVPETNAAPLARLDIRGLASIYARLIGHRAFMGYAASNALALSGLYIFFAGAPAVFIGQLHLTPSRFGLIPLVTFATYVAGSFAASRLAGERARHGGVLIGQAVMLGGAGVMMLAFVAGMVSVASYGAGMALFSGGLGLVLPIGVAGALNLVRSEAGTASALLGAMQMAAGALGGGIAAALGGDMALTFPALMALAAGGSMLAFRVFVRRADHPQATPRGS